MPTHSIITVVFNDAEGLRETLISLEKLNKDYYEHVIVDGGSADHISDVIKMFQNRIDIYISEPDDGIYDAMNKGVNLSCGSTISFLNGGDMALKNYLEPVARIHKANVDFCYSGVAFSGNRLEKIYIPKKITKRTEFLQRMPFPHPGLFVARRIFQEIGMFDTSIAKSADHQWICRMIDAQFVGVRYAVQTVKFKLNGTSLSFHTSLEMLHTARQFKRGVLTASFWFCRSLIVTLKYKALSFF